MEQLYAEEAEQMAAKQEEVWAREAAARQRLMAQVAASWKQARRAVIISTGYGRCDCLVETHQSVMLVQIW
jgi:hypothetical protein